VSEQIHQVNNNFRETFQVNEIAQSFHAVLRKVVERLKPNKSSKFNAPAVSVTPQVTNGYNNQSMKPKYFAASTSLLIMRRNTTAFDTAGVMNILNPLTTCQYYITIVFI